MRDPALPDPEIASHVEAWRTAIDAAIGGDDPEARRLVLPTVGPGVDPNTWSMRILAGASMVAVRTAAEIDHGPDEVWTIEPGPGGPLEQHAETVLRVVEALLNADPVLAETTADTYIRWGDAGVRARLVALLHYLLAWHTVALTGSDGAAPSSKRGAR